MQQFTAFTGLVIAVASVALGALVLASKANNSVNRVFALLGLSLAVWGFGYFMSFSATTAIAAISWAGIFMVGAAFIPATYLHFVLVYTGKYSTNRTALGLSYLLGAVFAALSFSSEYIAGVEPNKWFSFWPQAGSYYIYFLVFFFAVLAFSIYLLSKKPSRKELEVLQERYLIAGATIGLIGGATNYPLWYDIGLPPVGNILVLAFPVSITYAILKTRLFNIKVLLTEVAVGIVVFIAIIQTITLSGSQLVMGSLLTISLAVGGLVLIRSVRTEVDKREELEKLAKEKIEALNELEQRNKNLATLQQISDIVLNENDTKAMTQKILDELPKQLDSCVGGLLSIAKDGKLTAYAITQNNMAKKVISLIGGHLEKYSFPIKKEYNRIHEALVDKKSIDSDNLTDFISPPIPKAVAVSIQKITGAQHVEVFPLYAGGEPLGVMLFVFSRPGVEVHDKNYAIAKAISDDLSLAVQRAQAFEQLKAANEYLAQLDKMKDEFISMASHELNTPLAAIEGYLSMILDEGMGKIDKQSRTYLNRAYASSKRLAELILDLLNVSRIEQGRLKMKYEEVSVAEMIESVIHELQIKADSKKIYLKIEAPKDLPKVWCDPDRIREVIVNLTGNALKFTDKGGVTIKASQPDPKNIRVQVVDTGRGIAKEDQAKLFQKFSQVKREVDEHQGSGLGLYISKNFVELHNGKIWVDSETAKGATFSFELPLIKEPPKEVSGAVLESPLDSPRIERGNPMEVPAGIKESTKKLS